MTTAIRITLLALLVLCAAPRAGADAIVRSQAMFASTIAEYYVEPGRVRLELEIGLVDLEAFRNLLPDELYMQLGHPPRPLRERLEEFFEKDLVIATESGTPLAGRPLAIEPRIRVPRDDISGEPLPVEGEEAEQVLFVELEYLLLDEASVLDFRGLAGGTPASVGFVVYHGAVAVNDFRYLTPSQVLELDWEDPWYTRFLTRNLRRSYFAPMSGFIYVEPYEVRKEIIVRPKDLQGWIDLGLEGRESIPVEMQAELERKVAEFLRGRQRVTIDGVAVEPELARINFLERTLRSSRVIDPRVELDVYSAMLGVIFVYPTDGLPQKVDMEWDLFNDQIQLIPAASVDQAGPLPVFLEPDYAVLQWENFLKHPEIPTLAVIAPPPGPFARALWLGRWVLLAVTLAVGVWSLSRWRRSENRAAPAVAALLLLLAATGVSFWLSRDARLSDPAAHQLVSNLLHNVYRAFDFRGEEQIYDTLERSVTGDLLERIYLETRKGLELANQGGARAKVKEIELLDLSTEPSQGGGIVADATWNVSGSIGHWGHIHQRRNQYRAELHIGPIDGAWKLIDLQLLHEQRL
jgi:hypothetical protein